MNTLQAAVRPIFDYFPIIRPAPSERSASMRNTNQTQEVLVGEPPRKKLRKNTPLQNHKRQVPDRVEPRSTLSSKSNSSRAQQQLPPSRSRAPADPSTCTPSTNTAAHSSSRHILRTAREEQIDNGKRVLRSQHGGSRTRSELSRFWVDYDKILFAEGVDEEQEPLNLASKLYVTDRKSKSAATPTTSPRKSTTTRNHALRQPQFEKLDFSAEANHLSAASPSEDPLNDLVFSRSHKRGERTEKHDRNLDKEQAMFEKTLLERLHQGLQGPEWLKVLGLSGITDGERRRFEPKRDFFTRGVGAILKKFDSWKEQERALKIREEGGGTVSSFKCEVFDGQRRGTGSPAAEIGHTASNLSLAAAVPELSGPASHPSAAPISTFFSKRYLREAAISKHRRGRTVLAFGHHIPDLPKKAFQLPEDILSALSDATESAKK